MNLREQIVYAGNVNRIMEAHKGGMGKHAIAGMFRDHGIAVEAHQIEAVISSRSPLASKPLPKSVVRKHVHGTEASFGRAAVAL